MALPYTIKVKVKPITVAELPSFLSKAKELWSEEEKDGLIDFLACNPLAGDEIPGTGGLRKLRWSRKGAGKRGGARVIYYFYNESAPVFLITAYAKAKKENINPKEIKIYSKLVNELKSEIKNRS